MREWVVGAWICWWWDRECVGGWARGWALSCVDACVGAGVDGCIPT